MASVVYIHGLDNKPEAEYLHGLWDRKLAQDDGLSLPDLGVRTSMVYWADVMYPSPDTDLAAYEAAAIVLEGLGAVPPVDLAALPPEQRRKFEALADKLGVDPAAVDGTVPADELQQAKLERIPVPPWLRERLMKKMARDAYYYFFNLEFSARPGATVRVRDELRSRFVKAVEKAKADGPVVVLSHSMGTIIAYDCLKNDPSCPQVDALVTAGSPLGLDEVQDFFPGYRAEDAFPSEKLKGPWLNVYDPLDVVAALDPKLANDFRKGGEAVIDDLLVTNSGTWRHSISKYLRQAEFRRRLGTILGL